MGRTYAGILGPIAFTTIVARSLIDGETAESTLKVAVLCLFAFAAIGYLAGRIADRIVWESVKTRFDQELKAHEQARSAQVEK